MHTSCIYLERFGFYLYMQPKIISKCITLMASKRQRHTISDTGNMFMDLVSDRTFVTIASKRVHSLKIRLHTKDTTCKFYNII